MVGNSLCPFKTRGVIKMKRTKRNSIVILSTAAFLAMAAGSTRGTTLISPIKASAATANENQDLNTDTFTSGFDFLDKGNPSSMRERIEAQYSSVYVELYDKMQKELREQNSSSSR